MAQILPGLLPSMSSMSSKKRSVPGQQKPHVVPTSHRHVTLFHSFSLSLQPPPKWHWRSAWCLDNRNHMLYQLVTGMLLSLILSISPASSQMTLKKRSVPGQQKLHVVPTSHRHVTLSLSLSLSHSLYLSSLLPNVIEEALGAWTTETTCCTN